MGLQGLYRVICRLYRDHAGQERSQDLKGVIRGYMGIYFPVYLKGV